MTENERNEIQRMVTDSVHDAIGGLSERLDALNNPGGNGNPGNAGGNDTGNGNGNGDGGGNNAGNGNTGGNQGNGNAGGGDNPGGGMDGVSDAVKQWVAAKESNAGKNIDGGLKRRYAGNNNLNGKEI